MENAPEPDAESYCCTFKIALSHKLKSGIQSHFSQWNPDSY